MNEGNNEKESTKQTIKKHYFVSCSPEISPVVGNPFFKLILMFIGSGTTTKQGSSLRPENQKSYCTSKDRSWLIPSRNRSTLQ